MPISKLGRRRQVVIPKEFCEALGLQEGDFVEVLRVEEAVVIKPKRLVDADDLLTPEEEALVREGEKQLKRGESINWDDLKQRLGLDL
ncbi:MAG: AbrB/MazE/SpoVT family DNA-binding domain-containing protein [Candidatus Tectomicrobia bacterium]|nr:AbrB/MazE/SpoVT family DNA-binding domain-containing protein [Candidatus Tectomicrobia bacterium]